MKQSQSAVRFLLLPLLWLAFSLMIGSALQKSATVDEQSHLFRGAAYLKANATHFLLGHPIGNSALAALPVLTEPELRLPTEIPAWEAGNWSVAGDYFLWRIGNNAQRVLFLGRLPMIFCTLILGCLVFRWGKQLNNPMTGLFAATLILFDPNILAHGRLVSSDVTLTLFWAMTIYGFWLWAQHGKRTSILLAGFGLGMASLMKYNAAFLLPTLAILAGWEWWKRRNREPLVALIGTIFIGGVVIWGVNRFAFTPLPGGAFWEDLFWQMGYFGRNTGGYLLGTYDPDGSLFYFPIAFLIKTPIPTLLLLLLAIFTLSIQAPLRNFIAENRYLFVPAFIFCVTAFMAGFNIGIRHLLPLYPYLYLFTAYSLFHRRDLPSRWLMRLQRVAMMLLATSIFISARAFPNYLSYFNQFVGGSENGWLYLADSNVDWGQELPALAQWQRDHRDKPLYLSYFGTAHANAYGIEFEPIPAPIITPDQPPAERQAYDPRYPRPGYYAISINNLIGFPMPTGQRDFYASFRDLEPIAKVGNAIFIYEVTAMGKTVDVAFAGTRPELLPESVYELWETNDVRVRWFDFPNTRLVVPSGKRVYIVTNELPASHLLNRIPRHEVFVNDGIYVYEVENAVEAAQRVTYSDELAFLGFWPQFEANFVTAWEVNRPINTPLQIFAHATDTSGEILSQSDTVALDPFSKWQAGDVYLHKHQLDDLTLRSYTVTVGLYSAETKQRLAEPIPLFNVATSHAP